MGICIRLLLSGFMATLCFTSIVFAQDKTGEQQSTQESVQEKNESTESKTQEQDPVEGKDSDDKKIVVKIKKTSAQLLPPTTRLWLSIPDATQLVNDLNDTQFGQLAQDEAVQPFVEKVNKQIKDFLDKNNVDLGIKTEDLGDVHSGEITIAAVKNDGEKAQYGFIMMIDVEKTKVEAEDLLKKVSGQLTEQKATSEEVKLAGHKAIKWTYPKIPGMTKQKFAWHVLTDRWLIVCDNENLASATVERIQGKGGSVSTLAENAYFKTVRERCAFAEGSKDPQIKWFIEPFGYYDILDQVAQNNSQLGVRRNNYPEIFRKNGFDVVKGFGGNIAISDDKKIVYRSYLHAPSNSNEKDRKYKGAAEMLRFENTKKHDLLPEDFVSDATSGYMTVSWDMAKAFENVKPIANAIMGGTSFDSVVEEIHIEPTGPRVDLNEMVGLLDDRISFFTDNTKPINESSEKVVVAVKVRERHADVYDMLKRIINPPKEKIVDFDGLKIIIDEEPEEIKDDGTIPFTIDGEDSGTEDDDEEVEKPKPVFEKRVYASFGGYILMSNDLEYLKKLISNAKNKPGQKLRKAADFVEVNSELAKHVDEKRVSFRHFVRLDESVRVNYEMLRQGKMGASNTVLAKALNQILTPKDAEDDTVRAQEIDGSDLPSDFDKQIAPYLGAAGFALETTKEGWVLSGVVLPKKRQPNVASRENDDSKRE